MGSDTRRACRMQDGLKNDRKRFLEKDPIQSMEKTDGTYL